MKFLVPVDRTACGEGPYRLSCESVGLGCERVRNGVEMCGCPAGTKRDPSDRHSCMEGTYIEPSSLYQPHRGTLNKPTAFADPKEGSRCAPPLGPIFLNVMHFPGKIGYNKLVNPPLGLSLPFQKSWIRHWTACFAKSLYRWMSNSLVLVVVCEGWMRSHNGSCSDGYYHHGDGGCCPIEIYPTSSEPPKYIRTCSPGQVSQEK